MTAGAEGVLAACPWPDCGSWPAVECRETQDGVQGWVECSMCAARGPNTSFYKGPPKVAYAAARRHVITAWNTRTPAWRSIENAPDKTMAVLLYYGRLSWEGMGAVRTHVERIQVGWFQDGRWYEGGTGHDAFEDLRDGDYLPTHWMPAPELQP